MNVAIWVVQGLLAAAFLMAGFAKVSQPIDKLRKRMAWAGAVPVWLTRSIAVVEILGAIGLILPMATGILPWLTVAAASGLGLVMIIASVFHVRRGEASHVPVNVALLLLAVVIVIGRLALAPAVGA